jgi:hypothetical protein
MTREKLEDRQKEAEVKAAAYNTELNKLILKGAEERVSKIVVDGKKAVRQKSRHRKAKWWVNDQGKRLAPDPGKVYRRKATAEKVKVKKSKEIFDEFVCTNKRDLEIRDYTWIKVAGRSPSTFLRDRFSSFGIVHAVRLGRPPNLNSYILMGRADAHAAVAFYNSPDHNMAHDVKVGIRVEYWKSSVKEDRKYMHACGSEYNYWAPPARQ